MIKKRRSTQKTLLCVERLEDRTVLQGTGSITVSFSNGLLSITGDNLDDNVELFGSGGAISVFSSGPINGSAGPFPSVRAVSVRFLDGNDSVFIEGINIPG